MFVGMSQPVKFSGTINTTIHGGAIEITRMVKHDTAAWGPHAVHWIAESMKLVLRPVVEPCAACPTWGFYVVNCATAIYARSSSSPNGSAIETPIWAEYYWGLRRGSIITKRKIVERSLSPS